MRAMTASRTASGLADHDLLDVGDDLSRQLPRTGDVDRLFLAQLDFRHSVISQLRKSYPQFGV